MLIVFVSISACASIGYVTLISQLLYLDTVFVKSPFAFVVASLVIVKIFVSLSQLYVQFCDVVTALVAAYPFKSGIVISVTCFWINNSLAVSSYPTLKSNVISSLPTAFVIS